MTAINIIDINTLAKSEIKFDDKILESERGMKCVPVVVKGQLAGRRGMSSAKVKTMSEIRGGGRKPWKQKGTGRARQGSTRSVQFVGGRTCFGPTPRDFGYKMPKKIVKQALSYVLRNKIKEGRLVLVEGMESVELSTKALNNKLNSVTISNALVACENMKDNANFLKSLKNIKGFKALISDALNVYDIMNHDFVMIEKKTFDNVKEVIEKWA